MKKLTIGFMIVCILLLSGCNKKDVEQGISTIKSEEMTSTTSILEDSSSPSQTWNSSQDSSSEELWNSEKARELNQFVIEWGKTMKQTYREYTLNQNVDLYGLQFPQVGEGGWQAVVNDMPINNRLV